MGKRNNLLKKELKNLIRKEGFKYDSGKILAKTFFCRIDKFIKSNPLFFEIISKEIKKDYRKNINVIVSGEFGKIFENFLNDKARVNNFNLIKIKGSVRLGTAKIDLEEHKFDLNKRKTIFVDDSFCSGDTFNSIKKEVEHQGGKVEKIYIIYYNPPRIKKNILPRNSFVFFNFWEDFFEYFDEFEKYKIK